jgi:hypothetical protein
MAYAFPGCSFRVPAVRDCAQAEFTAVVEQLKATGLGVVSSPIFPRMESIYE